MLKLYENYYEIYDAKYMKARADKLLHIMYSVDKIKKSMRKNVLRQWLFRVVKARKD